MKVSSILEVREWPQLALDSLASPLLTSGPAVGDAVLHEAADQDRASLNTLFSVVGYRSWFASHCNPAVLLGHRIRSARLHVKLARSKRIADEAAGVLASRRHLEEASQQLSAALATHCLDAELVEVAALFAKEWRKLADKAQPINSSAAATPAKTVKTAREAPSTFTAVALPSSKSSVSSNSRKGLKGRPTEVIEPHRNAAVEQTDINLKVSVLEKQVVNLRRQNFFLRWSWVTAVGVLLGGLGWVVLCEEEDGTAVQCRGSHCNGLVATIVRLARGHRDIGSRR